jgi:hypothetical protein
MVVMPQTSQISQPTVSIIEKSKKTVDPQISYIQNIENEDSLLSNPAMVQ